MTLKHFSYLFLILTTFGALLYQWGNSVPSNKLDTTHLNVSRSGQGRPLYQVRKASNGQTKEAHSASLVELKDNSLYGFWYGGSREGAKDVSIYAARLDRSTTGSSKQQWQKAELLIERPAVAKKLNRYIRKLGNPVAGKAPDGRIWLFFVSVSIGGWAGSSINFITSDDDGVTWSDIRRLVTSPFLNVSTLVKGKPFFYKDGSIGLPVYHEFLGKFSEMLRIDRNGRIINKQRLTWGRYSLQPITFVQSEDNATSLMRYDGDKPQRILEAKIQDDGSSWSEPKKIQLPNPDSAISGLQISTNKQLLIFNNSPEERNILSLAYSENNGSNWKILHNFEHDEKNTKSHFSYPTLIKSKDNHYHLLYTWKKTSIKHIEFNNSWLEQKINQQQGELL